MVYLKNGPSCGCKGKEAGEYVTNCKMEKGEKYGKSSNRSNEQEQFEEPEHKLEICTKFLSSHRDHLRKWHLISSVTRIDTYLLISSMTSI
jgi:hypothetical protein